jgi:hypothetical protein
LLPEGGGVKVEGLRNYLLSVICAAMISGIVMSLIKGNKTVQTITKLLCGLFMIYTAVKPLPMLKVSDLSSVTDRYSREAQQAAQLGKDMSEDAIRHSIKEQIRAYILDKAQTLEADLQVEVELSDEEIPAPKTVLITGKISPYAKEQLSEMMERELGVNMENQKWN